jgi:hypothetical protein
MFSSNTTQTSGGYEIQRSLRFNSADTAFLSRTPSTASNRRTWTWSGWVKRSQLSTIQHLFSGSAGNPTGNTDYGTAIRFDNSDNLHIFDYTNDTFNFNLITTQVFRDVSAWYHIVVAMDDPQATASNRLKVYVNGSQITAFGTATYPAQNTDYGVNSTNLHDIGALVGEGGSGATQYFNGYMTEINFIDGQALTPSSFGEFNADTGVWQPKRYAGSYGTNGFYLNFSDNSNTTAATLGADYSGNGNNWTPNNFSVSAGAGNDSLVDVPTNWGVDTGVGGSVRGNYCTLNPLSNPGGSTLSNGNLDCVTSAANNGRVVGTTSVSSGKWYWEYSKTAVNTFNLLGGIAPDYEYRSSEPGSTVFSYGYYGTTGQKYNNATLTAYGASYTNGDIIGVALDMDAGTLTFYKNGVSQGVAFSGLTGSFVPAISAESASSISLSVNFGQRPFAYTAPSGFKALNTQNLPTPTIGATPATQAGKFFNPVLYTGNGTTNNISGVGFETDFVWFKCRNVGFGNVLMDRVRGITNARLFSNNTDAESTSTTYINSTNSDGFQLAVGDNGANGSGQTYVAWNWKANGAGVTNTAGSITSTVSANTTSGFSVVTFTAPTSGNLSVGHGLGVAPSMVITKRRDSASQWWVWHIGLGDNTTDYLSLNTANAEASATNMWGTVGRNSTVMGYNSGVSVAGDSTQVAYCFAEVPGYSRFGSYTGNSSTDGPFVFCGFRPKYVLFKRAENAGDWMIWDGTRSPTNVVDDLLYASLSIAEQAYSGLDFTANGFKIRNTSGDFNFNGSTYIFAAFAEAPQKFALAR